MAARREKAREDPPLGVRAQRVLRLVAVAIHLRGGQAGGGGNGKTADPAECVLHKSGLCRQLRRITDLAQRAAAAAAEHRAVRFDPGGAGGEKLVQDAESKALLHLDDPSPAPGPPGR